MKLKSSGSRSQEKNSPADAMECDHELPVAACTTAVDPCTAGYWASIRMGVVGAGSLCAGVAANMMPAGEVAVGEVLSGKASDDRPALAAATEMETNVEANGI